MVRVKVAKSKTNCTRTLQNPKTEVDQALRLARQAIEIEAVNSLRDQLVAAGPSGLSPTSWSRNDAISVLEAVAIFVSKIMDTSEVLQNGELLVLENKSTMVLRGLVDILRDLKDGNVDERLSPTPGHGGAAHKAAERNAIQVWIEAVEIVRVHEKVSYPLAQLQVEEALKKAGVKFRGGNITKENLRDWKKGKYGFKKPKSK